MSIPRRLAMATAVALALLPSVVEAQVAARPIARGAVLTPADIEWTAAGAADPRGAVAVGWVARRVIAEGEPLREPAVAPPPLVRVGEAVQAVWSQGPVTLSVRGTAMGTAMQGERVLVRIDARRRVEGTATAEGVVSINGESR